MLQKLTLEYILAEVDRLRSLAATPPIHVGISLGAAINARTSEVMNASQLWGPNSPSFALLEELRAARADLFWTLVNDVTALAAHFAGEYLPESRRRLCVITVSTGIGARIIDRATRKLPYSQPFGLQGEIGHLPVDFQFWGAAVELACDCGAMGHMNAYSSGRGIAKLMRHIGSSGQRKDWAVIDPGSNSWAEILLADLYNLDPLALSLVRAVTLPIARAVSWIVTIDPEVDSIVVCGGVANGLAPFFEAALRDNIQNEPLYLQTEFTGERGERLVHIAADSDDSGLRGAATLAQPSAAVPIEIGESPTETRWRMIEPRTTEYDVVVTQSDGPSRLIQSLESLHEGSAIVFVDNGVPQHHQARYISEFARLRTSPYLVHVPLDESEKSWGLVEILLAHLEAQSVPRRGHPVVALGGGTLLDAVGLAAGLYRRGVPYVRVPTTLLGLVDAGVGVKVGVNALGRKNRLGLFNAPAAVICDLQFAASLPRQELISGLGEVLKISLTSDLQLFRELQQAGRCALEGGFYDTPSGFSIVERSVRAMLRELSGNLWESELDRSVDLGHSVSQSLETTLTPSIPHGQAVAIDIALTLVLGQYRGITSEHLVDEVLGLMKQLGLPVYEPKASVEVLWTALQDTERHRGGKQRVPLIRAIGDLPVFVSDLGEHELERAWAWLRKTQ